MTAWVNDLTHSQRDLRLEILWVSDLLSGRQRNHQLLVISTIKSHLKPLGSSPLPAVFAGNFTLGAELQFIAYQKRPNPGVVCLFVSGDVHLLYTNRWHWNNRSLCIRQDFVDVQLSSEHKTK